MRLKSGASEVIAQGAAAGASFGGMLGLEPGASVRLSPLLFSELGLAMERRLVSTCDVLLHCTPSAEVAGMHHCLALIMPT